VSADGPSIASPTALLSVRKPSIVNVSIASMIYRDRPYNYMDVYKFNGTIEIILDYAIEPGMIVHFDTIFIRMLQFGHLALAI
jgi:hypothetical protein